jgi:hypothetical protein
MNPQCIEVLPRTINCLFKDLIRCSKISLWNPALRLLLALWGF